MFVVTDDLGVEAILEEVAATLVTAVERLRVAEGERVRDTLSSSPRTTRWK